MNKPLPALPMPAAGLLPHAAPMCCITTLLLCNEGFAAAEAVLLPNHILLSDGVLDRAGLVEIAAQTVAAMGGYRELALDHPPAPGYLVGVQDFTFYEDPVVNDCLQVTVNLTGSFAGVEVFAATILKEGRLAAEGSLKIYIPEDGQALHAHEQP